MKREEILDLVKSTAEAAYVLDPNGSIAAWNPAASELFGVSIDDAIGRNCSEVLNGTDECGHKCDLSCVVKIRAATHEPLKSYDIKVNTAAGEKWCSMTVFVPVKGGTSEGYTFHVARSADVRKRFEHLLRDFVVAEGGTPPVQIERIITAKNSVTAMVDLSARELEVLRLLSKGIPTNDIAAQLFISATTVNNHVQRILKKLSAHTRLEAIRLAEKAGLI